MKTIAAIAIIFAASCIDSRIQPETPTCDIAVARIGEWIKVDVATSCISDGWTLEYRVLSGVTVSVNEHENPCGTVSRTSLLATSNVKVAGYIRSDTQRVECSVSDER